VVAQLGAGGMGVVYRAEDIRLGRAVALKFVSEDLAHDNQAIQRLRSEARAASMLNHGNICTIYDVDEDEGHPFIVMELMKGQSLRDRLASGPLKIHQLVDIGIEIADALHAAHSDGIVHRDIKPGNIFLTDRGHVKILDFGLAKLTPQFVASGTTVEVPDRTIAGVTLGTVSYMSPEQATGDDLDGRTDLFSLGVVMYECATGRLPFPGKTSAVILAAILNRAPVAPVAVNPELPLRLQEVINNCLEKDRELRYQSAADLRADLKRVRRDIESGHSRAIDVVTGSGTSRPGATRPGTGSPKVSSWTDRAEAPTRALARGRSRALIAGAGVAVIAVIAGAYLVRQRMPATSPDAGRVAGLSDAAIQTRLAFARASLDAKNFRAALAYAAEVLAVDSSNTGAARIRDEARAMLARFDEAVAEARRRVAAGDVDGAARALETARALDSTAPSVSEISSRLAEQVRQREAVTGAAQHTRPPAAPATPRVSGASHEPAPSDPGRPARPPSPAAFPATDSVPPQISPRTETPAIVPAPTSSPAAGAPPAQAAVPEPVAPPTTPTTPAVSAPAERRESASSAAPSADDDEAAIRRVIATYVGAIEGKDLTLFRSIKPNLSREEERRLQDGFRAVSSQRVSLTILSIDRRGEQASVILRRRDTIQAGGRQETPESQQTMTLAHTGRGWVIVEIR
jgi:tRNA A-37 threonylcarbamoyl transferase component Bud32